MYIFVLTTKGSLGPKTSSSQGCVSIFLHSATAKRPSLLVRVTAFNHSGKIFQWDVTMLQPFGKKLASCPHGNIHSFSVFSREAFWLSSSWDLQLLFLRDLMHYKLQISFSHQGTAFCFWPHFTIFLAALRNPELCTFCNCAL